MDRICEYAHRRGARVLVEVHSHHAQQVGIAQAVDLFYDFALPPLILHALTAVDLGPLTHWLTIRPANTVTVLDTHHGIGVIDAGRDVSWHHYAPKRSNATSFGPSCISSSMLCACAATISHSEATFGGAAKAREDD